MGVCVSLMLDKEIPEAVFDGDGKALAACSNTLDDICNANGISPVLSRFMCDPEAEVENLAEGEVMEDRWYDSQDGLRTISGLIKALESPDSRARRNVEKGGVLTPLWKLLGVKSGMEGKWAETVIADLNEMERCLRIAANKNARFLLLLG